MLCLVLQVAVRYLGVVEGADVLLGENWFSTWGGAGPESPRRMVVDGGAVYAVGRTASTAPGGSSVFLLKYDLGGEMVWNVTWGDPGYAWPNELAVVDGSIYITGAALTSEEKPDIFLLRYDAEGRLVWSATWGGQSWGETPSSDEGYDVEVFGDYVYVVGTTTHNASSTNEQDVLLLKYDSEGQLVWQRNYGKASTYEYGRCLEVVGNGLVFAGSLLEVESATERSAWVLLGGLDADGELAWNATVGDAYDGVTLKGMVQDGESIYVAGSANADRVASAFVMCVDHEGGLRWVEAWPEGETQGGMEVIDGRLYLVGQAWTGLRDQDVVAYVVDLDGSDPFSTTWTRDGNQTGWDISVVGDSLFLLGQTSEKGETDIYLASVQILFQVEVGARGSSLISGSHLALLLVGVVLASLLVSRSRWGVGHLRG